jgi:PAS domain S-box-containing protein
MKVLTFSQELQNKIQQAAQQQQQSPEELINTLLEAYHQPQASSPAPQKLAQDELYQYQYQQQLEELVEKCTPELTLANRLLQEEINEHRRVEALLRAEKFQTELILNNVADAVVFTDTAGNILYVNPAWEQLTGYSKEEVIGENPRILKSGRTPQTTYAELWQTITSGEIWSGLLFNQRKDGVQYDSHMIVAPILDTAGAIRNYVAVQHDVTKERQLNAMKEAFIANAAHDLANPVAVLRASVHLLKRNPAQLEKRLGIIENQIDRLAALIRDLLTISQIDRQMLTPEFAPMDINHLVERVTAAQKALADEQGQSLVFTPQATLPGILADTEHLERVVVNLVSNAMNYTPSGGQIEVQTQLEQEHVVLSVKDTGIGIAPEDLPLIFNRFFRSDNAQA